MMEDFDVKANETLKDIWLDNYKTAPGQLGKMKETEGLISAFNANIDAVIKITGKRVEDLIRSFSINEEGLLQPGERKIEDLDDVIRGIIHCFRSGIAEEWLVEDEEIFNWLNRELGYDKLQMGGQGGIVANVMAVCGIDPVYVHCASLPSRQAKLFLDLPNLKTVNGEGKLVKAYSIDRKSDIPLIHWIIEFDKGDSAFIAGKKITCPKSNRFIATYDPLNFRLHIDDLFSVAMAHAGEKPEIIILSGYQMLREKLADGSPGRKRIDESMEKIKQWRSDNQDQILHLEMASTQDRKMRKYLLDTLATEVDSLGFNERELIDLLEVMGEDELVEKCESETSSSNLLQGMLRLFEYVEVPRMQLHMFGLYLTLQRKAFRIDPLKNRNGMQLAAVIAAGKAGTGSVDTEDVLLWARDRKVSDQGLLELKKLADFISRDYGPNELLETGIWESVAFDLIAVPTILIDKPVTLVGMGDTISSTSLVAAR